MRKINIQMSLFDTYIDVCSMVEDNKPKLLKLLDEHIDFEMLIPQGFYSAFHKRTGKPRDYSLTSFLRFCILQKILGIHDDKALLNVIRMSSELREYCGFDTVPAASQITRFKQTFSDYFRQMFEALFSLKLLTNLKFLNLFVKSYPLVLKTC